MSLQPSSLQAVVFDMDGLLFNTEDIYEQVMHEMCRRRNVQFCDVLRQRMMGRPGEQAFQEMIAHHDFTSDDPARLLQESDELFEGLLASKLKPMPGAEELLLTLEQVGMPFAIGTSSRRRFVDEVVGHFGWLDRFRFILTAENIVRGKPDPEIYLLAAERHGVAPASMMVLEDSHNGCKAAVAAGTFAVAVPGSHSRTHCFAGAALVADSLRDVRIYRALNLIRSSRS